jgi:hypothetical protein
MSHPAGYFATFVFDRKCEKKLGAKNKLGGKINLGAKSILEQKKMGSKKICLREMSHSLSKCRTHKPKCDVGSQGSKIRIFPE